MSAPRLLVLGSGGMLGHKLVQLAAARMDVFGTVRQAAAPLPDWLGLPRDRMITNIDVTGAVATMLDRVEPTAIVNCTGVIKPAHGGMWDVADAIAVNALAPHRLAAEAERRGIYFVHISTDCVFSGREGRYAETATADATDVYGRTKALGEVTGPRTLTIRTSMIGRELSGARGLVEWLLSHRGGRVSGYTAARFSGLTTHVLSSLLLELVERTNRVTGLWHVAAEPIAKYDLVIELARAFGADITVDPADVPVIDRSLDGSRFSAATGFLAPSWPAMVEQLASDSSPYDSWRQRAA